MAIEDAAALAESLGRSRDAEVALRSYESRRWPRVETIRAAGQHLNRHPASPRGQVSGASCPR